MSNLGQILGFNDSLTSKRRVLGKKWYLYCPNSWIKRYGPRFCFGFLSVNLTHVKDQENRLGSERMPQNNRDPTRRIDVCATTSLSPFHILFISSFPNSILRSSDYFGAFQYCVHVLCHMCCVVYDVATLMKAMPNWVDKIWRKPCAMLRGCTWYLHDKTLINNTHHLWVSSLA